MVKGFHHTGRTVRDMEASLAFYRDLLGLQVVDDAPIEDDEEMAEFLGIDELSLRAVMLSPDGETPFLELFSFERPGPGEVNSTSPLNPGGSHPCFLVDDIHAEYERLSAAGVRFTRAPLQIPEGPFEGDWILYGYDPDDAIVEFWSTS